MRTEPDRLEIQVLNCIVRCVFVSHNRKKRKKDNSPLGNQFNGRVKYFKFGSSFGSVRMQMLRKHVPLCYPPIRSYCHQGQPGLIPWYCTPWGGFDPSHHPPLLFWAPPGTTPTTLQRVVENIAFLSESGSWDNMVCLSTTTFPGSHFWLTKDSSAKTPAKTPPHVLT